MILRTGIIVMLFTLCLPGCSTTKPVVWKAQNVSFANFKTFEILPVFNATETAVKQDVLFFLTAQLKEQFVMQNLQLIDAPQTKSGVLTVKSNILIYKIETQAFYGSGSGNTVYCTLLTRLVDKSTTRVVSKISTSKTTTGRYRGSDIQKLVLKESAAAVAKEVAKMMQSMELESESSVWDKL